MRAILFILFVTLGSASDAQVTVNRLMLNANFGFNNYGEVGFRAQFDRFFTIGAYGAYANQRVGPSVESTVGPATHNPNIQFHNQVRNATVYVGISTPTPGRLSASALVGPSFGMYATHENITVGTNSDGSQFLTSDFREVNHLGFGFRGDVTLAISERFGFNAGVLGNVNGVMNYYKVHIGICIGMMDR